MVAVEISLTPNNEVKCGANLITDQVILTQPYCNITVDSKVLDCAGNEYSVDRVNILDDIAVATLAQKVSFGQYVQPIPIADRQYPIGSTGLITGWVSFFLTAIFSNIVNMDDSTSV